MLTRMNTREPARTLPFAVLLATVCLFLLPASLALGDIHFHVSPDGEDDNPGTRQKPFATVTRARNAIRKLKDEGELDEAVQVVLRGGTYRLREPLTFTPADSGTQHAPITYRAADGQQPVLSGGMRITGWKKDGRMWRTKVPEVAQGDLYFRQLFVNGKRAPRARTPNEFYLRTAGPIKPLADRRKARREPSTKRGFRFREGDIKRWENLEDVTIELYHSWTTSLHWIEELDLQKRIVRFTNQSNWPVGYWETFERYRIGNYLEALDSPGEWYLDRDDGTLYYWPREGEHMQRAEVVAPVLTDLVIFEGDPEEGRFIEHLTFQGLSFQHHDWQFGKDQTVDGQAHARRRIAAIEAEGLRDSTFRDCEVAHVGTHAFWLDKGCQDNRIERCHIHDTGGGGIYVGEPNKVGYMPENDRLKVERNVLENNFIHHTGLRLGGSIGIWIGSSSFNKIRHNEISDFDYTGISVGWCWNPKKDIFQRGNVIEYNHIHHNVGDILSDNGGIYALGYSPGSVMRGNVIHHIRHYPHINTSNGLYLDAATSHYTLENNLVHDIMGQGVLTKGEHNHIRNNILAFCEENGIWRLSNHDNEKITVERNIIAQREGMMISGYCHPEHFADIDRNLYWAAGDHRPIFDDWSGRIVKEVPRTGEMGFEEWQQLGQDTHSVVANPEFAAAGGRDFRLREDSPAGKVGFEEFDFTKAGLYGDEQWTSMPDRIDREPHEFAPPPPKQPINYGFEGYEPGGTPLVRGRLNQAKNCSIAVSDEAAATGERSLKFTDGQAQQSWLPHWSIRLDGPEGGRVKFSSDIMNSKSQPARFSFEFRDWSGSSYHSGPTLWFDRDGTVRVGPRQVGTFQPDTWYHVEIEFDYGAGADKTFTLRIGEHGGKIKTIKDLPFESEQFTTCTWFGITSLENKKASYYVDNVKLNMEE